MKISMAVSIRIRFALFIINAGMKLLPENFSNKSFIDNCIHTGKIKRYDKRYKIFK